MCYALVVAIMTATSLAACWVPAMRASWVHPVVALRAE
jgi:ABC-type lipoprotein release transport system permease subunit